MLNVVGENVAETQSTDAAFARAAECNATHDLTARFVLSVPLRSSRAPT